MIFNARKWLCIDTGPLAFDTVDINIGGGFGLHVPIRTFRAPVSGIYKMSFSYVFEDSRAIEIWVASKYEEVTIAQFDEVDEPYAARNGAYTWMMNLIKGDEINLNVDFWGVPGTLLCPEGLTFTGELISHDLN